MTWRQLTQSYQCLSVISPRDYTAAHGAMTHGRHHLPLQPLACLSDSAAPGSWPTHSPCSPLPSLCWYSSAS